MPSITRRRTARVGRPTTAEADIMAATERLLIKGATFTELGVQEICAEAGVARSTFYSHFRDKIDLVLRLATEMIASTFGLVSVWAPPDGLDRLDQVFLQIVRVYREHAAVRGAVAEVATYDATVRDFWTTEINRFTERTITLLRAEQEAGRSPSRIDPVSVTRVIVMGGERAIFDQVCDGDPASDAVFARELAETWWYGVYRRPAG